MHSLWTSTWKLYCCLEHGNVCNTIVIIIVYLFISIIPYKSGIFDMEYDKKKTYIWLTEHSVILIIFYCILNIFLLWDVLPQNGKP
jgi:hypothetical protein